MLIELRMIELKKQKTVFSRFSVKETLKKSQYLVLLYVLQYVAIRHIVMPAPLS